jgi:hypothetical protein
MSQIAAEAMPPADESSRDSLGHCQVNADRGAR